MILFLTYSALIFTLISNTSLFYLIQGVLVRTQFFDPVDQEDAFNDYNDFEVKLDLVMCFRSVLPINRSVSLPCTLLSNFQLLAQS